MGGYTQAEIQEQILRDFEAKKAETDLTNPRAKTNNGGFFKQIWADQVNMWKSLGSTMKTEGFSGIPGWAKMFFIPLIIFFVVIAGIWSFTKPKSRYRDGRRSHHGYNRDGKRY